MASLKIISDRLGDNSLAFKVLLPPRRNGEVNFAAAAAINTALLSIVLDAYDPDPRPLSAAEIASNDGITADGGGILLDELMTPEKAAAAQRFLGGCANGSCPDD